MDDINAKSNLNPISKSFLFICSVILLLTVGCVNNSIENSSVEIKTLSETKPVDIYYLRGIGGVSVKQSIIIEGIEYDLFCTFDDPHLALVFLENAIPDYISFLKKEYRLNRIKLKNLDVYYEKMLVYEQYLIDNNLEGELESLREESNILGSFCRIYHLDGKNEEIKKLARNAITAVDIDYLRQLLPDFPPSYIKYSSYTTQNTPMSALHMNKHVYAVNVNPYCPILNKL